MSNSLLWIYGKRALPSSPVFSLANPPLLYSRFREKCPQVRHTSKSFGLNSYPSPSSSIIQDLEYVRMDSAHVAYFFFDFKDTGKQDAHALLSSLLVQLSHQSDSLCNILYTCYSTHEFGSRQPSDRALTQCLQDMLRSSTQVPVYLIFDALDECPNTTGVPSSRDKVLSLIEKLVKLNLPNLHLCITSRPEIDIRTFFEPLTSNQISLHDESGQKQDIINYVNSVVYSDMNMRRWREEDKKVVIEVLSDKADGM